MSPRRRVPARSPKPPRRRRRSSRRQRASPPQLFVASPRRSLLLRLESLCYRQTETNETDGLFPSPRSFAPSSSRRRSSRRTRSRRRGTAPTSNAARGRAPPANAARPCPRRFRNANGEARNANRNVGDRTRLCSRTKPRRLRLVRPSEARERQTKRATRGFDTFAKRSAPREDWRRGGARHGAPRAEEIPVSLLRFQANRPSRA
mmetsp:Transcript_901/g.3564  ORF Transcript_901/g.3564 Transcript_901/m.3564 type:complete len:205 (+) Transcript_901:842-1456(+)